MPPPADTNSGLPGSEQPALSAGKYFLRIDLLATHSFAGFFALFLHLLVARASTQAQLLPCPPISPTEISQCQSLS
jgi:hypothetical protein